MLDDCITSIFEPGNPGNRTDSGTITTPHVNEIVRRLNCAAHS